MRLSSRGLIALVPVFAGLGAAAGLFVGSSYQTESGAVVSADLSEHGTVTGTIRVFEPAPKSARELAIAVCGSETAIAVFDVVSSFMAVLKYRFECDEPGEVAQ